ncbi:Cyclic AMP receptor-like protein [Baekduia alba]|nr:Cyclic AMP receptor-like protein [Baekduia alba]
MLTGARIAYVKAGEVFYRGAFHEDETLTLGLVVDGLLKVVMRSPTGREVTIRYAPTGAFLGLPAVLLAGPAARGDRSLDRWRALGGAARDAVAVRDSVILKLRPTRFREAMVADSDLASRLAVHLAEQLQQALDVLGTDLFLPVRNRVASHLLDLAERQEESLVVRLNHQDIAAAVGSVREVVARVIKSMEREGLVSRVGGIKGYLRLLDPAGLHGVAAMADVALARAD